MSLPRRFKFTTNSLPRKALPPEPDSSATDIMYWDESREAPPGFGVRVGKLRPDGRIVRTFVFQIDVNGKTRRFSIKRWDGNNLDDARTVALGWYATFRDGKDPFAEKRAQDAEAVTLRKAVEHHLEVMRVKRRQPRSIKGLADDAERYFGRERGGSGWLDRELRTITRIECNELHKRLTKERGEYAGNRALRDFRTVYRSAALLYETLPVCPTAGVTWNPEDRVGKPISWDVFPEFWRAIDKVKNPVRADLVRLLVLTGLRSLDARTIRWEELSGLDGDEPTLHRPNPKGGPKKSFTLPVTRAVAEILHRRREENAVLFPGSPWVFPTVDREGRAVVHVKNAEEDSLHSFGYTPHRARDTYATACEEAGVSVMATKLILNHRDQTITEGYQRGLSMGFLRDSAEKATAFLLEKARVSKAA